jgi:hypothetical protein
MRGSPMPATESDRLSLTSDCSHGRPLSAGFIGSGHRQSPEATRSALDGFRRRRKSGSGDEPTLIERLVPFVAARPRERGPKPERGAGSAGAAERSGAALIIGRRNSAAAQDRAVTVMTVPSGPPAHLALSAAFDERGVVEALPADYHAVK